MSPSAPIRGELCIVSHRCLGFDAPANSSAALSRALLSGVNEVELDFRLTRDGEFVACHSPWHVTSSGRPYRISKMTLAQAIEWGYMPLTEALKIFVELGEGKRLRIEMKTSGAEEKLLRTISQYGVLDRVVVVAWTTAALRKLRFLSPSVSLSLSYIVGLHGDGFLPFASPSSIPAAARDSEIRLESVNVLSAIGTPSSRLIRTLRERAIDVFVIGGRQVAIPQKFLKLGVSGVLTSSQEFLIASGREERPA